MPLLRHLIIFGALLHGALGKRKDKSNATSFDNVAKVQDGRHGGLVELSGQVLHKQWNCHAHCRQAHLETMAEDGSGGCPSFCGTAGACCRSGFGLGEAACEYGKSGETDSHVCVRAKVLPPQSSETLPGGSGGGGGNSELSLHEKRAAARAAERKEKRDLERRAREAAANPADAATKLLGAAAQAATKNREHLSKGGGLPAGAFLSKKDMKRERKRAKRDARREVESSASGAAEGNLVNGKSRAAAALELERAQREEDRRKRTREKRLLPAAASSAPRAGAGAGGESAWAPPTSRAGVAPSSASSQAAVVWLAKAEAKGGKTVVSWSSVPVARAVPEQVRRQAGAFNASEDIGRDRRGTWHAQAGQVSW